MHEINVTIRIGDDISDMFASVEDREEVRAHMDVCQLLATAAQYPWELTLELASELPFAATGTRLKSPVVMPTIAFATRTAGILADRDAQSDNGSVRVIPATYRSKDIQSI
jgi:hypothetical protein